MALETLLLTALFSLAAVAFIGALNARGPWRTAVAALLALLCLLAALWQTGAYRAQRGVRAGSAVPGPETVVRGAPAPSLSPEAARIDRARADGDLSEVLEAARALRDSLAGEDPSRARGLSDSEYQAFEARAAGHLARARMLRERAARLAASAPPGGMEEAAELLTLSLQSLNAAAGDLRAFFRADDRDEEQRLTASFRQGVEAAGATLRRAQGLAERAGAGTDTGF